MLVDEALLGYFSNEAPGESPETFLVCASDWPGSAKPYIAASASVLSGALAAFFDLGGLFSRLPAATARSGLAVLVGEVGIYLTSKSANEMLRLLCEPATAAFWPYPPAASTSPSAEIAGK